MLTLFQIDNILKQLIELTTPLPGEELKLEDMPHTLEWCYLTMYTLLGHILEAKASVHIEK